MSIINTMVTIGNTTANIEIITAPIPSPIAITEFPVPAVVTDDVPRNATVEVCIIAEIPPPAIIASIHLK